MDSKRTVGQLNSVLCGAYSACFADGDLIVKNADASFYTVLGVCLPPEKSTSFFDLVLPDDVERLRRDMHDQLETGNEIELVVMTRDGGWVLNRGVCYEREGMRYVDGVLVSIKLFKQIYDAQRQRLAEYAQKLSETAARASRDSLTMLYNAKTTRSLCEEYISACEESFALMIVDVDGFKGINDSYGHSAGDKVLVRIASIIKKLFRHGDVVGRIGGDEFLVLMKGVETRDIVDRRSAQILQAFADISVEGISAGSLSCSVGVAFAVNNNTRKYEELFCIADRAMYHAKSDGGNRFIVCPI